MCGSDGRSVGCSDLWSPMSLKDVLLVDIGGHGAAVDESGWEWIKVNESV